MKETNTNEFIFKNLLHRLAHQPQTKYIDNVWFTLDGILHKHKLSDFE